MDEQTRVSIDFLREALDVLLRHLEEVHGPEVRLEKEYFWSIPEERLYDVYTEPSSFSIGQLTECIANLQGVTANPEEAVSYGLVWIADLLRAVGQTVVR
ncbi:hypothetical protein [Arthrobacter ramosus]|uniref:Uncharacterized protein n=1 Tax=Arthrobacter ramosus TaxID=1672 RepID=A0ABV5Y6P1_ARTRM|nr:hypothetical protein [Arthrobacter ramosus]